MESKIQNGGDVICGCPQASTKKYKLSMRWNLLEGYPVKTISLQVTKLLYSTHLKRSYLVSGLKPFSLILAQIHYKFKIVRIGLIRSEFHDLVYMSFRKWVHTGCGTQIEPLYYYRRVQFGCRTLYNLP